MTEIEYKIKIEQDSMFVYGGKDLYHQYAGILATIHTEALAPNEAANKNACYLVDAVEALQTVKANVAFSHFITSNACCADADELQIAWEQYLKKVSLTDLCSDPFLDKLEYLFQEYSK